MTGKESEIRPIQDLKNVSLIPESDQGSRGWKAILNGQELEEGVSSLILTHQKMGLRLEYGKTPAGYDGLAFEEPGGGGSVIVPFAEINGEIYVGLVHEDRPFSGGIVPNAPRGFLNPGETHFQTAQRELAEETGYETPEKRIVPLRGKLMNSNSALNVAIGDDKGTKSYKLNITPDEIRLITSSEDPKKRVYEFNLDRLSPVSKAGERVMKSRFYHWKRALEVKDMFTVAAVGRLIGEEILERLVSQEPKIQIPL